MKQLFGGLFVAVVAGIIILYAEFCYFDKEKCPISAIAATAKELQIADNGIRGPISDVVPDKGKESAVEETSEPPPEKSVVGEISEPPKPFDFALNYLYRAGGQGDFKHFAEGSVLRSGDTYKLIFSPAENGYVYIYQIDSSDKIFRLFPSDDFKGADSKNRNPVKKGVKYFVPAKSKSFQLDKTVGQETLYFVMSNVPDSILERIYETMVVAQKDRGAEYLEARQAWDNEIQTRGIDPELAIDSSSSAPKTTWEEENPKTQKNEEFSVISKHLKNLCNDCVYIVNFEHE